MELSNIKEILKEILADLLENKIDRTTASKLTEKRIPKIVMQTIPFSDDAPFIGLIYWTIVYITSQECITTNSELIYLNECLKGGSS